ncbi:hypothetical protein TWF569_006647 [Orbilia oligospora]|uniref:Uncharacterized protein n=1 Tax=Orbilia oligospora TaxID=2813651 RepID=A0A7C8NUV5_ORBOL|nr:hypothetical protein TWF706_011414 [Orbilia oligospora]KAF3119374.1 hypothetical protein TWF594_004895 [Orbilia oligospora]KAF3133671.1 hypothetical protein TWF703_006728 [Orbilia oligospora]KAF3145017.1 hypothetical protein TWF569_006647 [Orbilia oligospora]
MSLKSIDQVLKGAMRSEYQKTTGIQRQLFSLCFGYVISEKMANPSIRALLGSAILEYVSDCTTFEGVRQAIIDFEEAADSENDRGLLVSRAVSRRSTLEFVDIRSFNLITGRGTNSSIIYPNEALSTMTLGAGWAGTIYEIIELGFPECMPLMKLVMVMNSPVMRLDDEVSLHIYSNEYSNR